MNKNQQRKLRHIRVRKNVSGAQDRPRLSVFRSNKYIYAQIIDDQKSVTLLSVSDIKSAKKTKIEKAQDVGLQLAKEAAKKQIKNVVFDRGGFKYHGRVKALADSAREGGLSF